METTANGTSPFQDGFGCTAPEGQDGTGLRSRSLGTTAQALIAGLMERERSMVPDSSPGQCHDAVRARSVTSQGERGTQIVRKLGSEVDDGVGHRVPEDEPPGMEELAFKPEISCDAIGGIATHRQTDRLEVDADLVRSPCLEPDIEECVIPHCLANVEPRDRLSRSRRVERVAGAVAPVTSDRSLDSPRSRFRRTSHERGVRPLDLAGADHLLQQHVRLVRARHDEQSGRVTVEPMDDPRPVIVFSTLGAML